ncbi:PIN domain protein [hydrothermal vent metagenome]|uniref:PIN domain protein n=1 Tax=hydrothermal vent metagenome TaxID=652676 RepID=A0A3B1B7X6_9ZZZZ
MKKILIDSGPLIALFDRSDKYHQASTEFIKKNRSELVTTIASITEVLHLLDFSRNAQVDFLNWVDAGAMTVEPITTDDFQRIRELIVKYSDLPMDFADACLVFLGEKMNVSRVATIDRDFDVYRLKGKKSFTTYIK